MQSKDSIHISLAEIWVNKSFPNSLPPFQSSVPFFLLANINGFLSKTLTFDNNIYQKEKKETSLEEVFGCWCVIREAQAQKQPM